MMRTIIESIKTTSNETDCFSSQRLQTSSNPAFPNTFTVAVATLSPSLRGLSHNMPYEVNVLLPVLRACFLSLSDSKASRALALETITSTWYRENLILWKVVSC